MTDARTLHAFLLEMVPELGAMARAGFRDPGAVTFKRPGQPVTSVDTAIEAEARRRLAVRFPGHAIEGEEGGGEPRAGIPTWHIDPIDGTMNFVRGIPFFSVSIGVSMDGRVLAGAVLDPLRDELFHAVRGGGAWLGERAIRSAPIDELADAAISMQTAASGEYLKRDGFLRELHRRSQKTRKLGSIALEMAYVACGRMNLLLAGKGRPQAWWDIAGGWILIEEAGGLVVDAEGLPLSRSSTHIVAGSPVAVRAALELLRSFPE